MLHRFLSALFLIASSAIHICANAQKSIVTTEQVRAELVAHAPQGAVPGQPVWVGLQISHQPEWHTYWKNAGDSGLPTTLSWTLPPGVTAGDIAWPLPHKIPVGTLANYGYEGTVLLPVPLTITPAFKPSLLASDLEVKLHAAWLVCRKECIPQEGDFTLKIPVKSSTGLNAAAFDAAQAAQPQPLVARSNVVVKGNNLRVSVTDLPPELRGKTLQLFPETPEITETAAEPVQNWEGDVWTADVPLAAQRSQSPDEMPLVLVTTDVEPRRGFRTLANVSGNWPAVAAAPEVPPALAAALQANSAASAQIPPAPSLTWGAALLGALLGGLILNLMPCVFPVLAIKVMGFAQHAGDRRAHRTDGLAYSAGVVLSFLALGGLMLGLRAGGEQLGWGFQLQSPAVVAALAALFTLIGLNLAGLFEFGQFLPSRLSTLQARNPALNAFLSGVLAVAVASPCTAPFMGASLGLAVGLPAVQALPVFAVMGLGMALPYLAASLSPAVARLLPRPGAWMLVLRKLLAIPMLATVAWLVWVLAQQSGTAGATSLLALLAGMAVVLWTLRQKNTVSTMVSIAATAVLALAIGHNITQLAAPVRAAADGRWQAWEPGRVEQTLATGQPVMVDFSAAWCITCQYNERTTLAHPGVLADLDAKNVQLLRADWTRRDPAITAALGQLGRNGVPVYVLYKPGSTPQVLSEVLNVDELRAAIAQL